MATPKKRKLLLEIYGRLYGHFGPRHWWPADTPFEVIVGAILTQNASWKNAEKAIANLKRENMLSPKALDRIRERRLASIIRPSGFYNVKSKRLKNFVGFLFSRYNSTKEMLSRPSGALRKELLEVKGLGPETVDSILLYAAGKPVFVVDAYTKRIFSRHGLIDEDIGYEGLQRLFTDNLPRRVRLFNEYHALIVETGKDFCRRKPLCGKCPLRKIRR